MATPREVLFVVLPRVVLLDLAGPADVFRNAEAQCPGSYRLRFIAPQASVRAASGLLLGELEPLPARLAPGTILVCSPASPPSTSILASAARRVIDWLRSRRYAVVADVRVRGQHPRRTRGCSPGATAPRTTSILRNCGVSSHGRTCL